MIKKAIEDNRKNICQKLGEVRFWLPYVRYLKRQMLQENKMLFPQNQAYMFHSRDGRVRNKCLEPAFDYVLRNASENIDAFQLRSIHSEICKGTDVIGGTIRTSQVLLPDLNITPPTPDAVYYRLEDIFYNISDENIHPVQRAIQAHYDIVELQPYTDFNKRTARMVMNWVLLKYGYSPILFNKQTDRNLYIDAIANKSVKGYYEGLFRHVLLRSQEDLIRYLNKSGKKR